jgi:hypothetical protein
MCVIHIPFGAGGAQETACLPLHLLNYWLATVDANRIRDEHIRERIWLYKRQCAAVLAAYFITGKVPDNPDITATLLQDDLFAEPLPRHGTLTERVDRLEGDFGEVKKAATAANVNSMLAVRLAQGRPMKLPDAVEDRNRWQRRHERPTPSHHSPFDPETGEVRRPPLVEERKPFTGPPNPDFGRQE